MTSAALKWVASSLSLNMSLNMGSFLHVATEPHGSDRTRHYCSGQQEIVASVINQLPWYCLFHDMGSWGDQWIKCDVCSWGAVGGRDHYDIDGFELTVLCRWCFQIPNPPYWWGRACTAEPVLRRMKLLPNCLQHTAVTGLIADYLCMNCLV